MFSSYRCNVGYSYKTKLSQRLFRIASHFTTWINLAVPGFRGSGSLASWNEPFCTVLPEEMVHPIGVSREQLPAKPDGLPS